jgi:hypothetical protein
MRRFQVLIAVMSLALGASLGQALAFGPGAGQGGTKVAQVRFVDPKLNLVQLSDGMELRAPDHRMLTNLTIGEWVKVDFVSEGDRVVLNSIAPAPADEIPTPARTTRGGPSRG